MITDIALIAYIIGFVFGMSTVICYMLYLIWSDKDERYKC